MTDEDTNVPEEAFRFSIGTGATTGVFAFTTKLPTTEAEWNSIDDTINAILKRYNNRLAAYNMRR